LTEGKFSFPIIHAIHSRPDDRQVIRILIKTNLKYCTSAMVLLDLTFRAKGLVDITKYSWGISGLNG
jgi:hypothetical protein